MKKENNEIKVYYDLKEIGENFSLKIYHVPMEIIKELYNYNKFLFIKNN